MNLILCSIIVLFICIILIHLDINNYSYKSFTYYSQYKSNNNVQQLTSKYKNIIFLYSHDYKTLPDYCQYAFNNLKKYCDLHNYKIIIKNHYPNNTISPYWLRVKDLLELSNNYPQDSTIIIYLDLDTIINLKYKNIKINELIYNIDTLDNNNYDIYIGKDIILYKYINTGVIIIKNSEYTKNLLQYWYNYYNPIYWKYKNNKWTCMKDNSSCVWAGYEYEQGSLEHIYKNNLYNSQKHIKILHTSFCSTRNPNKDAFIYHFMARNNQKRKKYMKELQQLE